MMPRWGHSLTQNLLGRETGQPGTRRFKNNQRQQQDLLCHLEFEANAITVPLPPATDTAGLPIVVKFNKNPAYNNSQLLAIGGEEGFITIANAADLGALQRGTLDGSWRPRAHWPCHRNSIFDLAWAKNDAVIYTASGHQQVGIWDTDTGRGVAVAEGHEGSVKAVSPLNLCEDIFATGARDGRIMLWDARCPGFSGHAGSRRVPAGSGLDGVPALSPVWVQEGAHSRAAAPASRRSSQKIAKPAPVTVTSVAFIPYSYMLASAGAQDTVVKLWDLRMHGLPMCDLELPPAGRGAGRGTGAKAKASQAAAEHLPHEVASFSCPARAAAVGVTHIAVSDSGDRLLVSCLDSQHHLFSLSRLDSGPVVTWGAPPPAAKGSFYMRSAFSPCGNYVLSGSRDCGAHIWSIADPQRPPVSLPHEHEVTGVAWCSGDWAKVATCSDSGEAKVWTLSRLPARPSQSIKEDSPVVVALGQGLKQHVTASGSGSGTDAASADLQQKEPHAGFMSTGVPVKGLVPAVTPGGPGCGQLHGVMPTPPTDKPAERRMVQSLLNLERTARATPIPAPPAPAPVVTASLASKPDGLPLSKPPLAASIDDANGGGRFLSKPASGPSNHGQTPVADGALISADAIRATALRSPISAAPALPSAYPPSGRRRGALPPVPVFSPAVNLWQLRPTTSPPASSSQPDPPQRAQPVPPAARPPPAACNSLEEAMRGLTQVRTQSPARQLSQQRFDGADGARAGVELGPSGGSVPAPQPTEASAPLPPTNSFPPPAGAPLAARAPAMSPGTTPGSFFRSRSRLGPFSPSRSSHSSGSGGPFSSGGGSGSGGSGTPRHHQPQGVVSQIIRNSPRPGSRTGGVVSSADFALRSPHTRRCSLEGRANSEENAVQRQLFPVMEDEEEFPPVAQQARWTDGPAAGTSLFGWRTPNRALGTEGPNIIADVASLLQAGSGLGGHDAHPDVSRGRPPPSPARHFAYDLEDGQDVGPALRHRAMYPDDLGPFDGVLQGAARPGMAAEDAEDGDVAPASPPRESLLPTSLPRLEAFAWDAGVHGRSVFAGAGVGPEEDDEPWAIRRVSADGGARSLRPLYNCGDDSDSDSEWEFDPCADKENTPPPEPLEAPPASSEPRSSASGGGASTPSMSASPRPAPSVDLALPLLLLEPAASVEQRQQPSAARLPTPFALACPIPDAAPSSGGAAGFTAEAVSSLQDEPTVSAGIGPSSTERSAGSGSDGVPGDGMPSLGQEWLAARYSLGRSADDAEPGNINARMSGDQQLAGGRRNHPCIDAVEVPDADIDEEAENPTPTKRARRAYSSAADRGCPSRDRSPSPTRRVRSYDRPPIPCPTPSGKLRPGVSAAVLASPCIRGSLSRGPGGSRLAPPARGGYLIAGADLAAAGVGSESPAPKVGTASRTGGRKTPAAEEYFRRRAEEEREGAVISPFGFGELVPTPASCGGEATAAAREPAATHRGTSRLARSGAQQAPFSSGRLCFDDAEDRSEPAQQACAGADGDDGETIQASVRSLSCIFETQTQDGSTMVVPCSNPADEDRQQTQTQGDEEEEQEEDVIRDRLRRGLWPFEERTVISPALGTLARDALDAAAVGGEQGGSFDPTAGLARHSSGHVDFGSFFGHSRQGTPSQRPGDKPSRVQAPIPFALDEASRCFPVAGLGPVAAGRASARPDQQDGVRTFPDTAVQDGLSLSMSQGTASGGASDLWMSFRPETGAAAAAAAPPAPAAPAPVAETNERGHELEHLCRRARQQTLKQCWGGGVIGSAAQPLPLPLGQKPAGMPPVSGHRALGPTGLTSPRYFR